MFANHEDECQGVKGAEDIDSEPCPLAPGRLWQGPRLGLNAYRALRNSGPALPDAVPSPGSLSHGPALLPQHPPPAVHSDLCRLQPNVIIRSQSESQAGGETAQNWLHLKESYSQKRQVAPFKIPHCPSASAPRLPSHLHNRCCGSSCPLPALVHQGTGASRFPAVADCLLAL